MAKYPLEQVLAVKKDRVKKAERVVEEKKRALEVEEEKLKKVREERNKTLKHHEEKLLQLRTALDTGTTSDEVLQMKAYLKVVKIELLQKQERVEEQKKHVKVAEEALEEARVVLKQKRLEEEKIIMHKEQWTKEAKKLEVKQEAKEQDELGQLMHEAEKRKRR